MKIFQYLQSFGITQHLPTSARHVVIIAFDPIRAIVSSDRLLLVVPPGADSLLTVLTEHMKGGALPNYLAVVLHHTPSLRKVLVIAMIF